MRTWKRNGCRMERIKRSRLCFEEGSVCLDEKLWFAEEPLSPGHSVRAAAGEWDVPAAVDSARRGAKETLSTDSRRRYYALDLSIESIAVEALCEAACVGVLNQGW
ncbi:hypothetical protein E2C01_023750 [Portunus trituberculatus]|uniref:Uncharacterized protein n=1 Tax=Portunus trituberculatus TaxID=210409 RepID=A0A5B7EBZ2_PORTR|nr:hypothetical protein [Portunus trituberculatus]